MDRRALIGGLVLGTLSVPRLTHAQPAQKVPRIGRLEYGSAAGNIQQWLAFRERLRELGYVEGESIAFENRRAEGRIEQLPDLAAGLVRRKVDILVAVSLPASLAAKQATQTIPIVFHAVSDPVRFGLVQSLARPGGNITGVSTQAVDLAGKRLQLLREIVPGVSRFAVLWEQPNPNSALQARETEAAGRALGLSIQSVAVRVPDEFNAAFSAMRREGAGALVVAPSAMFFSERKRLAGLALENALPTVFAGREFAEAGALVSYGANFTDEARRAAVYVAKILKGAKPAELPIEQASKFELVINLRAAKALGVTIPQSLLLRADEVIQ